MADWYKKVATTGSKNVTEQKTNLDSEAGDVVEIAAKYFEVPGAVTAFVKKTWEAHLVPSHVRVEPYKIQMYGPGCRSSPPRDPLEKDFAGTFLLGLGDTTAYNDKPNRLARKIYRTEAGEWVAFYPGVDHVVPTPKSGYRAVHSGAAPMAPSAALGCSTSSRQRPRDAGRYTDEGLVVRV